MARYIELTDSEFGGRFAPLQDEPAAPIVPIVPFSAAELDGRAVPVRLEHVTGMIPACNVTLLSGDGGTGKSLLALQLAAATATGARWLGVPTMDGVALFITAEDDADEVHRRLDDIRKDKDLSFADYGRLHVLSLAGEDAILAAPESRSSIIRPTQLFRRIAAWVAEYRPALVVLDTLADLFAGNENDRAQARQFISQLRGLALKERATFVLLAHPSLTGLNSGSGTSGSTGWSNSVRSRLYLERVTTREGSEKAIEADPDLRVLRLMKANYSRTGSEVRLRWQQGVFAPTESPGIGGDLMLAETIRAERVFVRLLTSYRSQDRNVSSTPGTTYAPAIFAKDPGAEGVSKSAFNRAMCNLFAEGVIAVEEFGPASKRRQRIVFKTGGVS